MSAAFARWHRDWELEQAQRAGMTTQQHEHELAMQRAVEAKRGEFNSSSISAAREGFGREWQGGRTRAPTQTPAREGEAGCSSSAMCRLLQQSGTRFTAWLDTYREYQHTSSVAQRCEPLCETQVSGGLGALAGIGTQRMQSERSWLRSLLASWSWRISCRMLKISAPILNSSSCR